MAELIPIIANVLLVLGIATFVICGVVFVFNVYYIQLFNKYLKFNFPRAWSALGEPDFFWNNSLRNGALFDAVLNSNVHEEISDQRTKYLLLKIKLIHSIYNVTFRTCLISFVASAFLLNI